MIQIKISNIDKFQKLDTPSGCVIKPTINPADYGMAFDSVLADYFLSFAHDVSVQVVADYLVALLLMQKDDRGPRNVYIEKIEINVNALSEAEIRNKVNDAIKQKMDSTIDKSEKT